MQDIQYYSYRPVMSYGTRIIAICGARGIGKTYGAKKIILNQFRSKQKQFIWVRDTGDALKELTDHNGLNFYKDIQHEFEKPIRINGTEVRYGDDLAGLMMPLSTFYNFKGNSFPEIKWIVFDEFIPEIGQRITFDRARAILNQIETIGRTRPDIRFILLANALNKSDPILELFNVDIKGHGIYINRKKSVALHYAPNDPKFDEARKNGLAGLLAQGTVYEDVMYRNNFEDDSAQICAKMPPKAKLLVILHNDTTAIRLYHKDGKLYARRDMFDGAYTNYRYVTDITLVNSRYKLLPEDMRKVLLSHFENNNILFEYATVKNHLLNILKKR